VALGPDDDPRVLLNSLVLSQQCAARKEIANQPGRKTLGNRGCEMTETLQLHELREDNRLGGQRRLVFWPEGKAFMQLPPDISKCASFLAYEKPAVGGSFDRHFAGTGFFVAHALPPDVGGEILLFITARHVIERTREIGTGKTFIRINNINGNSDWIDLPEGTWRFHDDPSVDLAICAVILNSATDLLVIHERMFLTQELISKWGIGPGDDIFITGLFTGNPGTGRNEPIIRSGNVAAMPTETFQTSSGYIDGYLIESRSIGGLSGSPVFVHLGTGTRPYSPNQRTNEDSLFFLMGLIRGHWDHCDAFVSEDGLFSNEKLNMGIAIVTPTSKIAEMIQYEAVQNAVRTISERKRAEKNLPVGDSVNQSGVIPS
jgi:hypothetical protein